MGYHHNGYWINSPDDKELKPMCFGTEPLGNCRTSCKFSELCQTYDVLKLEKVC